MEKELQIIGEKEKISFPDLRRRNITARIDTGAKSSSIHCEKVWVEKMNNEPVLCCFLLRKTNKVTRFTKFRTRKVKSSNGVTQNRYSVKLKVKMGDDSFVAEFTLNNRDKMTYPVLIGRRILKNRYIVDVSREFVLES